MDWNKELKHMKHYPAPLPREEKLREVIQKSQEAYYLGAREGRMNGWEFLWSQLHYTRKRWWVLQAALLLCAFQFLPLIEDAACRVRSIGVIGCLFVVFMIPELWRNKDSNSTQVEAACLYSLRQIYAARMVLFGIVDVFLLTVFYWKMKSSLGMGTMEMLSQLLLPVTVTACICFTLLCGKRNLSETAALSGCLIWSALWWLLLMNEWVYRVLFSGLWAVLFGFALLFLIFAVRRTVRETNQYWEVSWNEIATG